MESGRRIVNRKNLNFMTFTNKGYVDYTHNLLSSIKENNLDIDIKIYALDQFSLNYFDELGANVKIYQKDDFADTYLKQDDKDFGNLMIVKFELIYKELLENDNVVYVDGDITFKKDLSEYLINFSNDSDIIFQNDLKPSKPDREWVCAGFMYIKSSKKTLKFFKPTAKLIRKINKYSTHDQTYINKNKKKFSYTLLPLDDFPNGAHYYQYFETLDPFMIHFNYIRGDEKQERMKFHNEWYL